MAIDIFRTKDYSSRLYAIESTLFNALNLSVLQHFHAKTGVLIDEYGDCRISTGHAKLLLELIRQTSFEKKISEEINNFCQFLNSAIENNIELEFKGD